MANLKLNKLKIRKLWLKTGTTIEEFAEAVDLSPAYLQSIISDTNTKVQGISDRSLTIIARALGTTAADLLDDTEMAETIPCQPETVFQSPLFESIAAGPWTEETKTDLLNSLNSIADDLAALIQRVNDIPCDQKKSPSGLRFRQGAFNNVFKN